MMLKSLLNKEVSWAHRQEKFIQSLEGIGDILVFETRKKKNKFVIENLQEIFSIFETFFAIKDKNPEKFDKLVLGEEFQKLYEQNKEEAGLRLAFNSEKYLVGFSSIIDQLVRVHEAGVLSTNDEVSRSAIVQLIWILEVTTKLPGNDIFVEQIVRTLSNAGRLAMKHDDRSTYLAFLDWYSHAVFGLTEREKFHLSYLETLDSNFFGNIRYIISNNKESLFHRFVASLVDGLHISIHNDVFKYAHAFMNIDFKKYSALDDKLEIEKNVRELDESYEHLYSKEALDKWLAKFEVLKENLEVNFPEVKKEDIEEVEKEVRDAAISKFKYNNLLEGVFSIGAYCVAEKKYEFIKYLWEYKQPPDADASWVGHDIVPENLEQLIDFYFRKSSFERKMDFRDGHKGSERYYKFYFLLLLLRYLKNIPSSGGGQYPQFNDFRLPDFNVGRLSSIEHETGELITLGKDLVKEGLLLHTLGFDANDSEELERKMVSFLIILKEKAELGLDIKHQNKNISPRKVNEFKNGFVSGFYENANFRDIFRNFLHQYQEALNIEGGNRLGINQVEDKAVFFDSWYVHYGEMGEHYGSNMAILEDAYLFSEVEKNCEEAVGLDKALEQFSVLDDAFIVFSGVGSFFSKNENFHTKWSNETPDPLDVKGYEGRYKFQDKLIPVFEVNSNRNEDGVLILSRNQFGSLNQYSPLNNESPKLLKDIFYMKIQALSDDEDLMDKLIQSPPEWLSKIKEKEKRIELLNTRALIQIFGSYEFKKHPQFAGYFLKIKSSIASKTK
jgi:hypothetical protein